MVTGLLLAMVMQSPVFGQAWLAERPFQSLAGEARFYSGIALGTQFSAPDFDDDLWPAVVVPGMMSEFGADTLHPVAWLRVRFTVEDLFDDAPLALVGFFHREYELYLNGQKIHATPHFGVPGLTAWAQASAGQFAAVALPKTVLAQEGSNVLAIRFSRVVVLEDAGVLPQPFGLVEAAGAASFNAALIRNTSLFEGAILGINGLLSVFAFALILLGFKDRSILWFAVLINGYFLMNIYTTQWAGAQGLQNPWTFRLFLVALVVVVVANFAFGASLLSRATGRVIWWVAGLLLVSISPAFGTYAVLPAEAAVLFQAVCSALFLPALIVPFLAVTWMALGEGRKGNPTGWYMLLIYGCFVAAPVTLNALDPAAMSQIAAALGGRPQDALVQLFVVSLSTLFAVRLLNIEKQRVIANERAINAQAQERQRVARDLHDSVGQWLSSVKLRLQTIGAEVGSGERLDQARLNALVGDMDVLIDDTRRIARDLSPSLLEHQGLRAALEGHVAFLRNDHGLHVDFHMDEHVDLEPQLADHFYRIVQEATSNAIMHGAAHHIDMALISLTHGKTQLTIADDGGGFAQDRAGQDRSGQDRAAPAHSLGLRSISERAAMMNGHAEFESPEGGGTLVRVVV